MKFIYLVLSLSFISSTSIATDTHPQLCENIRVQLSEDCSEESDTVDKESGTLIKRTYLECYKQDFETTIQNLNKYLTDELGLYVFDSSYENDQVICDKGE
jgi:hypothetical protein